MNYRLSTMTASALLCVSALACAQSASGLTSSSVQNVAQLSASGSAEGQQDVLAISLTAVREGADATAVQNQLKAALDRALTEAKKLADTNRMAVRTGSFGIYPRYGKDGKISGWQGSSELLLEGQDFPLITSTSAKLQGFSVSQVSFMLSREHRARLETQAQAMAIERFKANAALIARGFGFGSYTLREVSVNANEQGFSPRLRAQAAQARQGAADVPLPVEAGKTSVQITVTGSVQMK